MPNDATDIRVGSFANENIRVGAKVDYLNSDGVRVRIEVHGPDASAPDGSNAASGPIYRIRVGTMFMDADGNLYPRGIENANSPNYDPVAINATHIPFEDATGGDADLMLDGAGGPIP